MVLIQFSSNHQYYLFRGPTDMRKGFDGLSGLVQSSGLDLIKSNAVFVFINRRRDKIKLLVWDRSGLVLYYKRLEQGSFELPLIEGDQNSVSISWQKLVLMLEGICLKNVQKRKRYKSNVQ